MPKCYCDLIPEILERLDALEYAKDHQQDRASTDVAARKEEQEKRAQRLQQRLEQNNKKTQDLNSLAQKLVEEMKLLDQAEPQPAPQSNIALKLQKQQDALESMEKLFSQTTAFFAQMYDAIKPYYDMPDLKDIDKPTCILQGLENIMHGVGKMAQELTKDMAKQE